MSPASLLSQVLDDRVLPALQAVLAAIGLHLAPAPAPAPDTTAAGIVRRVQAGQAAAPEAVLERVERELAEVDRGLEETDKALRRAGRRGEGGGAEVVKIATSFTLEADERAGDVVVVLGDATIDGDVGGDVVVVGGRVVIRGRVGGDVVNVGVGVELGPEAEVGGDVVGVGGGVRKSEGARVGGEVVPVELAGIGNLSVPSGLRDFFTQCVVKLRPLSFGVRWVWPVWATLFLVHLVVAALFPRGTVACSTLLRTRPAAAFGTGILVYPLVLILAVLLLATGVGVLILPFLFLGLKLAGVVGKNGVMHHLGGRLLRGGDDRGLLAPLLLGGLLIAALYLVPVVGLLAWLTLGTWGLGAATLALLTRGDRGPRATPGPGIAPTPLRPDPVPPTPAPAPAPSPAPTPTPGTPAADAPVALSAPVPEVLTGPGTVGMPDTEAPAPAAAAGPAPGPRPAPGIPTGGGAPGDPAVRDRVGLGRRIGAAAIDLAGLALVMKLLPDALDWTRWGVAVAYFTSFWVLRGTTLGGLILRMRVVRLDGRPIDVATALVRSLGAFLSVGALGIGYFWCAWDPERQTWHDKLAGTVVVHDPGLRSLV